MGSIPGLIEFTTEVPFYIRDNAATENKDALFAGMEDANWERQQSTNAELQQETTAEVSANI